MLNRRFFALCGATIALSLTLAVNAFADGTQVTVRVEGLSRTLLPATVVHTHGGSITKGTHSCPATTAAGAFDAATHHRWNGSWSAGLGFEITQIFGETHVYSANGYYWSIWVDNEVAPAGICGLTKLHRGEQLLFAPAPAKGTVFPIGLSAPRHATAHRSFTVNVFYYNAKGVAKPLAGARVKGAAAVTGTTGIVTVTAKRAGTLKLTAGKSGYIRSAAETVSVAS